MLFHREGDRSLLVVAANGAADWNPDWFHNLVADPHVEVEIDGLYQSAHAAVLEGDDWADTWATAARAFPGLEATQREVKRVIPLIRLTLN